MTQIKDSAIVSLAGISNSGEVPAHFTCAELLIVQCITKFNEGTNTRERERVEEREWGEGGEMDVLLSLETIRYAILFLVVLSTKTLAYGNSMIA